MSPAQKNGKNLICKQFPQIYYICILTSRNIRIFTSKTQNFAYLHKIPKLGQYFWHHFYFHNIFPNSTYFKLEPLEYFSLNLPNSEYRLYRLCGQKQSLQALKYTSVGTRTNDATVVLLDRRRHALKRVSVHPLKALKYTTTT